MPRTRSASSAGGRGHAGCSSIGARFWFRTIRPAITMARSSRASWRRCVPVVAGISLEYYFSYVDPTGYGCGTKLPHNVTSLLGVMDGAQSDLRTGLPWQMVEIHEPTRLAIVVEGTPRSRVARRAGQSGHRTARAKPLDLARLSRSRVRRLVGAPV